MSSTFDSMQHALSWLEERVDVEDLQAKDVLRFLQAIIERLHDHCHKHDHRLNLVAGREVTLLETALRYEDNQERQIWLNRKTKKI